MRKNLPSWRKQQKVQKTRRIKTVIRFTLLGIVLVLLIGIGFKIYRSIAKSVWDGQSQLNLAINPSIADQPVLIAAFNPEEKSLNVLLIPPRTFIETIHGYGPYRVESIYRLGELNKKGGELFQGSLQEYLGIPVDAFASISNFEFPISNETKNSLSELLVGLLKSGKTNLTKWDVIRLWWSLRNIRQDKVNLVDLGQTSASQEVDLLDGTKANKIDTERLESIMSQFFVDKKLDMKLAAGIGQLKLMSGYNEIAAKLSIEDLQASNKLILKHIEKLFFDLTMSRRTDYTKFSSNEGLRYCY